MFFLSNAFILDMVVNLCGYIVKTAVWSEILREVSSSKSSQALGILLGRESIPLGLWVFA